MESIPHHRQGQGHRQRITRPETLLLPSSAYGQPSARGKRKTVHDYVEEYEDLTSYTVNDRQVLVCQFCAVVITTRSDRIKEHLTSKKHIKTKLSGNKLGPLHLSQVLASSSFATAYNMRQIYRKFSVNEEHNVGDMDANRKVQIPSNVYMGHVPPSVLTNHNQAMRMRPVVPTITPTQYLHIQWSEFDTNIRTMFNKFLDTAQFSDVSLWVEEKPIKCHRLILAAASPVFEKLCIAHENANGDKRSHVAIIPLPGYQFSDVEAIVKFIYNGEFDIRREDIVRIAVVAHTLEIKGLMDLGRTAIPDCNNGQGDISAPDKQDHPRASNNKKKLKTREDVKSSSQNEESSFSTSSGSSPSTTSPQPEMYVVPPDFVNNFMNIPGHGTIPAANGSGQNHNYILNYPYPAIMYDNDEEGLGHGLSRGVVELMTGIWDRQNSSN